jgi:hypothetical protein
MKRQGLERGTSLDRGKTKSGNKVTDHIESEVLTAVVMKYSIS